MITKFKKYNIRESIYTERDINNILDKGNFDESDLAVLNSYATDDKDIKEVIKKMKDYQKSFELLNKQMTQEKDGFKKRQLFKKWLGMHEELSELENELRFKYKIEDPNKIKKLEESFNFSEKYEFDCILITITNSEEASKTHKIIYDFCLKYDIGDERVYDFFDNIIHNNALERPIYIRLVINKFDNVLILSWGRMSNFEENQETTNYSYEKFFTVTELERGVLDDIMKYGKSNARPSYKPRQIKRTLESVELTWYPYRFKTEKEMIDSIGFNWKRVIGNEVGWNSEMIKLLGQPFPKKNFDMYGLSETDWLEYNGDFGHWTVLPIMLTKSNPKPPSYEPRKIVRTLENINENFRFFYNNETLERESNLPKFRIGDKITIKPNGSEIHLSKIQGYYTEIPETIEWINKNIGKKLVVEDVAVNEMGLWVINCKDDKGDFNYIQQDALINYAPNYSPRKIDRSLD